MGSIIFQMGGQDAQRSARALDEHFERRAPHAAQIVDRGPGQQMVRNGEERQSRKHHVAELAVPAIFVHLFHSRAEDRLITRQQFGKTRRLVLAVIERGKASRHFLEAEHIRIGHGSCGAHDAGQIRPAVATESALDIPAEDLHGRLT
jgi:hypothetical protein